MFFQGPPAHPTMWTGVSSGGSTELLWGLCLRAAEQRGFGGQGLGEKGVRKMGQEWDEKGEIWGQRKLMGRRRQRSGKKRRRELLGKAEKVEGAWAKGESEEGLEEQGGTGLCRGPPRRREARQGAGATGSEAWEGGSG